MGKSRLEPVETRRERLLGCAVEPGEGINRRGRACSRGIRSDGRGIHRDLRRSHGGEDEATGLGVSQGGGSKGRSGCNH